MRCRPPGDSLSACEHPLRPNCSALTAAGALHSDARPQQSDLKPMAKQLKKETFSMSEEKNLGLWSCWACRSGGWLRYNGAPRIEDFRRIEAGRAKTAVEPAAGRSG